ncbi:MAG TPA: YHS domain-containing (seleno)protein [Candidatus Obscuribacterales bacterium]
MRALFIWPLVLAAVAITGCGQNTATEDSSPTAAPSTPIEAAQEAAATVEAATTPAVYVKDDVAIAGADPVAYFTDAAYVPGSADFAHEWGGATWYFASAANRDAFASNPEQYAPQYGGFCAWAVSQGYTAKIDPEAWKIVEGKLYLNYDKGIQAKWEKDIPGHITKADANWPAVLNQ